MNKEIVRIFAFLVLAGVIITSPVNAQTWPSTLSYDLGSIPEIPAPAKENSVQMDDSGDFEETKLDLPVSPGPFKPTWESIEKNYPGTPDWLRKAKFGFWVHFGPQSAGKSGDWYARKLYTPRLRAYKNHLKNYGHPSEVGYKDVLKDWNPEKLDPAKFVDLYRKAGARFLIIQGVHHDQFDNWDSKYQPWNSVNIGPKRDIIGEWAEAARDADIRFGITFHHEYSWWWWQSAFQSDTDGPKAGVPYDGNLTLADGKGKWWEGMDPRLLYGINLREYKTVASASNSPWSPPAAGIFQNHLEFSEWYAKWWALRMMDAVDKYQPDFIYTDGTDQQPFSGYGTGTGYRCDAMQRVMADFYNKTLKRRGKVDVFSVVKFRRRTNGTVNTQENHYPRYIKTDQDWFTEHAVGDWYWKPDIKYSAKGIIQYLLECVSRDGCYAVNIPMKPDGSLEEACTQMFKDIGEWMGINGEGIYGSKAWARLGEGSKSLPAGHIGWSQHNFVFSPEDFRFTVGENGCLYAYCMTVPSPGTELKITSLGTESGLLAEPVTSVSLLGYDGKLTWSQETDALHITCPDSMGYKTAICFKIGPDSIILPIAPSDLTAEASMQNVTLKWLSREADATYTVKRSEKVNGNYKTLARGLTENKWVDSDVAAGKLYYYVVTSTVGKHESAYSDKVLALLPTGKSTWDSQDIGDVGSAGSFTQAGNTLLVKGSGSDIWNRSDEFRYVYKTLEGDTGQLQPKLKV